MRQLDPVTNLVLAVLAGLGMLGTLSMPWFAPPASSPTATDGPIERFAWKLSHFFGTTVPNTTSGSDAVGNGKHLLILIVLAVAVLAVLIINAPTRKPAEDLMRVAAFAAPVAVVLLGFTHPGVEQDKEVFVHYGFLASFAVSCFMCSCAWHGATLRARRRQTPRAIRVTNS